MRRISVGSALARAGWGAFMRAAAKIAQTGGFDALGGAATFAEAGGAVPRTPGRPHHAGVQTK